MKNFANSRVGAVAIGASAIVVLGGTGAYAATQITSGDIKDQTIQSRDIHSDGVGSNELKDNSATMSKLGSGVQDKLNQVGQKADQSALNQEAQDRKSGDDNLQGQVNGTMKETVVDGPYTNTWKGDNGATMQSATVKCDPGYVAIGGGFSGQGGTDDAGNPQNKDLQITASFPYTDNYQPINDRGSFRANEWVVKGFNNGSTDQVVRPWVVCAQVNGSGQ